MRRMNETELNDEQIEQIDALEFAAYELLGIMSDGEHYASIEDAFALIELAKSIVEKNGLRAHFPAHIFDGDTEYTVDYTDEELKRGDDIKNEYWVSVEKYTYYRMCVGKCNSIEEAREKAYEMIRNGDDEKWITKTGDGGTEIKGFCDSRGDEVQYPGEDYYFWDEVL